MLRHYFRDCLLLDRQVLFVEMNELINRRHPNEGSMIRAEYVWVPLPSFWCVNMVCKYDEIREPRISRYIISTHVCRVHSRCRDRMPVPRVSVFDGRALTAMPGNLVKRRSEN